MACTSCSSGSGCSCGQLTVNQGKPGNNGVGVRSITSVVNVDGTTTVTVLLTSNLQEIFTIPAGQQGQSVDHISITTSTLDSSRPPQAGLAGATDVYTAWADAAETISLGTFTIYNGQDGDAVSGLNNLGTGEQVFVTGSTFDFKTVVSDNLSLSSDANELKLNDSTYPAYLEIPVNQAIDYSLDMSTYNEYQRVHIVNRSSNPVDIDLASGNSFESHNQRQDATTLTIFPLATVVLARVGTRVEVLTYSSNAYEREQTDYVNDFTADTEPVFARKTDDNTVFLQGRIRWAGTTVNDLGSTIRVGEAFRPPRNVHFTATGIVTTGNATTLNSMGGETRYAVHFTLQPNGLLTITGVSARLQEIAPTAFNTGNDVRFIKTYLSSIRFSATYISGPSTVVNNPTV